MVGTAVDCDYCMMEGVGVEMLLPVVGEPGVEGYGVLRMNPGVIRPGMMCGGGWGVSAPKRFVGVRCVLHIPIWTVREVYLMRSGRYIKKIE